MRSWIGTLMVLATTAASPLHAQAPAGAPAGSTALCKDGSYGNSPTKSGACSGHKGVKTWYGGGSGAKAAAKDAKRADKRAAKTADQAPPPSAKAAPSPTAKPAPAPMPAPAAPPAAAKTTPMPAPAAPPTAAKTAPPPPPVAMPAPPAATKPAKAPKSPAAAKPETPAPGGGNGLVWVNSASKIYHCPGAADYGKTKEGGYMSEAAAKAAGNRAARNKACS